MKPDDNGGGRLKYPFVFYNQVSRGRESRVAPR